MSPRRKIDPAAGGLLPEPAPKPPRQWRFAVVATLASLVVIGAIAASALILVSHESHRREAIRDVAVLGYVRSFMTEYTSLDPFHANDYADRILAQGTGDFGDQYRKYSDAIAPVNKQAKVSNSTQVVATAVESLTGADATALVYTNTSNSTPQSKDMPSLSYLSYRLDMQRHGSRWLITKMTTITSLDLTPKLG